MKVALCTAPVEKKYSQVDKNKWPPLWAMCLASYVQEENSGIDIRYFDGTHHKIDQMIEEIVKFNPKLVCLSPVMISYKNDLKIAQALKENIDCRIILGGHHATNLAHIIIKNRSNLIDAVIQNDGEYAFKKLCKKSIEIEQIPNAVIWSDKMIRTNKKKNVELNETPIPWLKEAEYYKEFGKQYIYSQKGCLIRSGNRRCVFCARTDVGLRFKSPERVVNELKFYLQGNNSVKSIFEVCDDFICSRRWLNNLADEIENSGLRLPQHTIFASSKMVNKKVAKDLLRIGVSDVILGFESAEPSVLAEVGKGFANIENNVTAAKILLTHGISVVGSYVFGLPKSTPKSIELSFKQVEMLQNENGKSENSRFSGYANVLVPFPGSFVFEKMCLVNKKLRYIDIFDQQELQIEYLKIFFKMTENESEKYLGYLCSKRDKMNKKTNDGMIYSVGLKKINKIKGGKYDG
jgi:radical SAM superfamily enzyme YgiQ (UPF0313 family)